MTSEIKDWFRQNAFNMWLWAVLWFDLIAGCWLVTCGNSFGVIGWFMAYLMFLCLTVLHLERGDH